MPSRTTLHQVNGTTLILPARSVGDGGRRQYSVAPLVHRVIAGPVSRWRPGHKGHIN